MEFDLVGRLMAITLLGSTWVLWLLVILSVISVAIMIERGLFFNKMRLNFAQFSRELTDRLIADDAEGAEKLCLQSQAIECQVALKGLKYKSKGVHAMEESMAGYMVGEKQSLDTGLVVLGTLGNNAPFIGLFGTVIGIIQAFHDLSSNPAGGPSVVMSGISEALIATAVGLLVAIPAVIAYNSFQRVVKRKLANAEAVMKLITAHYSRS